MKIFHFYFRIKHQIKINLAQKILLLLFSIFTTVDCLGQAKIIGQLRNKVNNEPIISAVIQIQDNNINTITDTLGKFKLITPKKGIYNLIISCIGYKTTTLFDLETFEIKDTYIDATLEENATELNGVTVRPSDFHKTYESPVSLKTLSSAEIERMPGGFRDISRVIQAFPGVASPPTAWRNDIIIRGGASYENKFFLDGIQIPNINHFSTQGSAAGAYGLINPSYLKEANIYSGAFPSNRGNALSSIFEFRLKDGSPQPIKSNIVAGTTDFTLSTDGKLSNKITYISSVRVANWNLISKTLGLFVLPVYSDALIKIKYKGLKQEFTVLGVGANDNIQPNLNVESGPFVDQSNVNVTQTLNRYLKQLAFNRQWNFTVGGIYKHYFKNSNLVVSGSYYKLYNKLENYTNQIEKTGKYIDYASYEGESNVRVEHNIQKKRISINYGFTYENQLISVDNYLIGLNVRKSTIDTTTYNSNIAFNQYSIFSQFSYKYNRGSISFGLRSDASDFSHQANNFFSQFSPRVSFSYDLTSKLSLNFNSGLYYQTPLITMIAYKNAEGIFANKDSLKYMRCFHIIGGIDYLNSSNLKISLEGFFKSYQNAPFLKTENIPLATYSSIVSQQAIGNAPSSSQAVGKAYGIELLIHQKLWKGYYGILSYTFLHSMYKSISAANYIPSVWDYRHTFSLTGGKRFANSWEVGMKYKFLTGSPYTPINQALSSLIPVFNVNPIGYPDFAKINSQRFNIYSAFDLRVEKTFIIKRFNVSTYIDIQNLFNSNFVVPPFLGVNLDANHMPLIDSTDPTRYDTKVLTFKAPFSILPTSGVSVTF
ncbi:MAG: carboxypeptidase-like regulatory domain-containing protein [Siphonobacter sp.]